MVDIIADNPDELERLMLDTEGKPMDARNFVRMIMLAIELNRRGHCSKDIKLTGED